MSGGKDMEINLVLVMLSIKDSEMLHSLILLDFISIITLNWFI